MAFFVSVNICVGTGTWKGARTECVEEAEAGNALEDIARHSKHAIPIRIALLMISNMMGMIWYNVTRFPAIETIPENTT